MAAPIAKSDLSFQLPNLSYVDARWEEPSLRSIARPQAPQGFGAWLAARFTALRAWHQRQDALAELEMMSERELMDIGLNRGDLHRVFQPEFNQDLLRRGVY